MKNLLHPGILSFQAHVFFRINVPCETLMRIPVPNTKTPLKKYRRPLPPRHTQDSWSDEVCVDYSAGRKFSLDDKFSYFANGKLAKF